MNTVNKHMLATVVTVGLALLAPTPAAAQPTDALQIGSVVRAADGAVWLHVVGRPGTAIVVECSADLERWAVLTEEGLGDLGWYESVVRIYTLDVDGTTELVDVQARTLAVRYYRVREFP